MGVMESKAEMLSPTTLHTVTDIIAQMSSGQHSLVHLDEMEWFDASLMKNL